LKIVTTHIDQAEWLIDICFAHIDACFYSGRAHLGFVNYMLEHDATLVANRLYDLEIPVLEVSLSAMARIHSGDLVTIDRQGVILIGAQA
jgi:hypothetical protein